jgi:hypothetical protein
MAISALANSKSAAIVAVLSMRSDATGFEVRARSEPRVDAVKLSELSANGTDRLSLSRSLAITAFTRYGAARGKWLLANRIRGSNCSISSLVRNIKANDDR